MLQGFKTLIEPLNKELSWNLEKNYKDVSGVTHIYVKHVKDEPKIDSIGYCLTCGNVVEGRKFNISACEKCDPGGLL